MSEVPYVDEGPGGGQTEFLVLDIGGDVGALIVFATERCLGREIDLTPAGQPRSHHTHTMIRRRRAPTQEYIAGVYPELVAGDYTLWGFDGEPLSDVRITGGQVTQVEGGACGLAET